jgi:phenylpropionate dioxygenase-like ring-hydroxylating dioxygenase large terminal subunit
MTTIERVRTPSRLNNAPLYDWDELIHEDRVHRLLYTDPNIFDVEMSKIFGGTWVYLAHESQIPNVDDYITGRLGLRPLIITRDSHGVIRALYNRCTHRGTTLCRWDKGNSRSFQCPYHGWSFLNTGKLRGVPWPSGYAENLARDPKYNLAQVPRVESYRGFIFGTLNLDAPSLVEYLGPIKQPIDEWLDRNPGGKVVVCEANRFRYNGNWKLAYDNSGDGYHVIYSHRSLLETENRFSDDDGGKGMSYYKDSPDERPMYIRYMGNGHHFKDKRPNLNNRPGGLWAIESLHPGMEHVAEKLRGKFGARAESILDLAGSEPVNINVFPNLSLLGNHIQVFQPVSFNETDSIWYGTKIEDVDGSLGEEVLTDINALRMRTQEGFPNFGEVDDVANFEQIQRGLDCIEDEWIYMNRGLGIPDRIETLDDGTVKGPATDELFMREYIREWKRLMKAEPRLTIQREVVA